MLSVHLRGHLNQFSQPNGLGTYVCLGICVNTVDLPISPVSQISITGAVLAPRAIR
jgi:hypothetical protein